MFDIELLDMMLATSTIDSAQKLMATLEIHCWWQYIEQNLSWLNFDGNLCNIYLPKIAQYHQNENLYNGGARIGQFSKYC